MAGKADLEKMKSWMRRRFVADRCGEWDSTIHIHLKGAGKMTAGFGGGKMRLLSGPRGDPLAVIRSDAVTLKDILRNAVPLELAVMRNELETDNMVEVFKFVTVFRPDARSVAAGGAGGKQEKGTRPAERAPLLEGGDAARGFLEKLNEKIAGDGFIKDQLKKKRVKAAFVLGLRNPDMGLSVRLDGKGMRIGWLPAGAEADAALEASLLHGILSGAQNITIGLTDKNLDGAAAGIGAEVLELLIHIQPALAKLYREVRREGARL